MRSTTSTTVANGAASFVQAELRLARRGAAASAEATAGCLHLDADIVRQLRLLAGSAAAQRDELVQTQRIVAATSAYAAVAA